MRVPGKDFETKIPPFLPSFDGTTHRPYPFPTPMLRSSRSFQAPTDRQRLLISSGPLAPTRSDHQRLTKPAAAQRRPVHLKADPATLAIYGKDGTFISLDFGYGRLGRLVSTTTCLLIECPTSPTIPLT
jgi:hypothetical protein